MPLWRHLLKRIPRSPIKLPPPPILDLRKKNHGNLSASTDSRGRLAAPSGFEPKACRLGGGCSIQLSYGAHIFLACGC